MYYRDFDLSDTEKALMGKIRFAEKTARYPEIRIPCRRNLFIFFVGVAC